MLKVSASVKTTDRSKALQQIMKDLADLDVLVGIPEDKSSRPGEQITNAELAFIHTNGSPLKGIPARPIIEPAINDSDNRKIITDNLKAAAQFALDGNKAQAMAELNRAGLDAQNLVRAWFVNPKNNWAPNAPSTIAAKGSDRPLIDTSQMRRAIVFVVRRKGQ